MSVPSHIYALYVNVFYGKCTRPFTTISCVALTPISINVRPSPYFLTSSRVFGIKQMEINIIFGCCSCKIEEEKFNMSNRKRRKRQGERERERRSKGVEQRLIYSLFYSFLLFLFLCGPQLWRWKSVPYTRCV